MAIYKIIPLVSYFSADGNYEVRYKSNVLIYPNGEVLWVPPAIYQSSCTIDVTYFPFDQQTCIMKVIFFTSLLQHLNLSKLNLYFSLVRGHLTVTKCP